MYEGQSQLSVLLVHRCRNQWIDDKIQEKFSEYGFVVERVENSGQVHAVAKDIAAYIVRVKTPGD